MQKPPLPVDPYNLIITGVGGQGNVLASRVVGNMLLDAGFEVTIGETFGASQRGGSVMSHLRISSEPAWSPQIPKGKAHLVVALEPTEALRVLMDYGNPDVGVLCNMRPIHSIGVISGQQNYPEPEDLKRWICELSGKAWFVNVTEAAMKLGDPIYGNIMLLGALSGTGALPLSRESFRSVISGMIVSEKVDRNLAAFDQGKAMITP
jgi:indolepyruvate ferredoxin oxidoreductase beta subunit